MRKLLFFILAVPILLAVAAVAAWALDNRSADGEVVRNVTLAGRSVGGRPEREVRPAVEALARRLADVKVNVETDGRGFSSTLRNLGGAVDVDGTVDAVMDVGRTGSVPGRAIGWVGSFLDERDAPVRLQFDQPKLRAEVARLDPDRKPPVEPSFEISDGEVAAVDGEPGTGIDSADVAAAVEEAATDGDNPFSVEVDRGELAPRFTIDDASRLAARAEDLASRGLTVSAADQQAIIGADTLRTWMRAHPGDEGLELRLAPDRVQTDLAKALPGAGEPAVDAGFTVSGGGVTISPSRNGTRCCGEEAPRLLLSGLQSGQRPVAIPLRSLEPKITTERAQNLQIKEVVGEFTTNHAAGQPRVQNIHRIADLTRGVVILPNESFSVNGFVGPRTRDKGFVDAPVIYNGRFESDVGGGISQYATTLFNAAFFAGLDYGEYQSHSIAISRYPYGREATLSYPHPDLILENHTPHGVLIWTSYTESSITVQLWSTRYSPGQQTGQSSQPRGPCRRVTTERTRTFADDGHTEQDFVFAIYRPAEGVPC